MINSYSFGRIVIDGKEYTRDIIVFPDHIETDWWRKEGHKLCIDDIKDILKEKPEVLVVGTGYYGLMKVLPKAEKRLNSEGIKVIAQMTREACKTYNDLLKSNKVVAAFHLTC